MALQGLSLAIGFFSGAALARSLGVEGRGNYQVVALAYGLSGPLLNLGLPSMLTGRANGESLQHRTLLPPIAFAWIVGATLILLLPLPLPVRLSMAGLLIGPIISPYTEVALYRQARGSAVQALRVVDVGLTGIGVITCAALGNLSTLTATFCLFGGTVLLRLAVVAFLLVSRSVETADSTLKAWVSVSVKRFWPWDCVVALSVFADSLVAAFTMSRSSLGIYAVALALARLCGAGFSATAPLLVAGASQGEGARRLIMRYSFLPACVGGVAVLAFAAWGPTLVAAIYGSGFREASMPAFLLMIATLVGGLTSHTEAIGLGADSRLNSPIPRLAGTACMLLLALPLALLSELPAAGLAGSVLLGSLASMLLTLRQVKVRRVVS
jgi:O-antigen/teichoic acid export membrane protein